MDLVNNYMNLTPVIVVDGVFQPRNISLNSFGLVLAELSFNDISQFVQKMIADNKTKDAAINSIKTQLKICPNPNIFNNEDYGLTVGFDSLVL